MSVSSVPPLSRHNSVLTARHVTCDEKTRSLAETTVPPEQRNALPSDTGAHPSGASSWLNAPTNRARVADAVALIHRELAVLGAGGPATLNP